MHDEQVLGRLPVRGRFEIEGVIAGPFDSVFGLPEGEFPVLVRAFALGGGEGVEQVGLFAVLLHAEPFRLFHLHVVLFHGMDEFDLDTDGFIVVLADDIVGRDDGAEMGEAR